MDLFLTSRRTGMEGERDTEREYERRRAALLPPRDLEREREKDREREREPEKERLRERE